MRIPESFQIAKEQGLEIAFGQADLKDAHPNSALLLLEGEKGRKLSLQASSLGGGRIMVNKLDGIDVNCSCEMPTLIIHNQDQPGCVSAVTSLLFQKSVNIANMSLYRDRRGGKAVLVVEMDQPVSQEALEWLRQLKGILGVTYINAGGEN